MAKTDDKGNWLDSTGVAVPQKYVKPVDKKRDAMVERLHKKAVALQERMIAFKAEFNVEVEAFLALVAKEVGRGENKKGNYQFAGFSGHKRVSINRGSFIDFDERLQFAKTLVDNCLERWSEGGNDNLKAVVFDAFKVNKRGQMDRQRILSLRRLNIKDKVWQQAMELIGQALTVTGVKDYISIEERENGEGKWRSIRLDIAAL